jgi:hypothetical protein
MSVASIKKELGISNDIISFYNPDLSRSAILNNEIIQKGYRLKYPKPDLKPAGLTENSKEDNS